MSQKLIAAVARSARLRVLNALKRAQGLSVQELADLLGMSYMGIKDLCNDLEGRRLVKGRREPRPEGSSGRPRILYRLTEHAHDLFPVASNPFTLEVFEATKKLFGSAAPDKLLMLVWQQKAAEMEPRVKGGNPAERAASLAKVRDREGHMASVEGGRDGKLRIVEHHCPFLDVLRAYPSVAKLETELFRSLIGAPIERREENPAGVYHAEFAVGT